MALRVRGGQRFGRLVVLVPSGMCTAPNGVRKGGKFALCVCDCGKWIAPRVSQLLAGGGKSCGCLRRDTAKKTATKHGMWGTAVRNRWNSMIQRCTNSNAQAYADYGGRGITVCERWLVFENFLADMGEPPTPKHSLERRVNSRGYEPSNCIWATSKQQARNRRNNVLVVVDGVEMTATEAAERAGMEPRLVLSRLRAGWSIEKALAKPARARATGR